MPRPFPAFLAAAALSVSACSFDKATAVDVRSRNGEAPVLTALSRPAAARALTVSEGKPYRYSLNPPLELTADSSLELTYQFKAELPGERLPRVILRIEDAQPAWELPPDAAFLGFDGGARVRYRIPLGAGRISGLSFEVLAHSDAEKSTKYASFSLSSLSVRDRWYGFAREGNDLILSPFVYRRAAAASGLFELVIDPPVGYRPGAALELSVGGGGPWRIAVGADFFQSLDSADRSGRGVHIPAPALPDDPFPLVLPFQDAPESLVLSRPVELSFPNPIPLDPGLVLAYDRARWRDRRYEVFAWDRFPSVLIFDTADYAVQDKLFKRLAFFVEKAGFRGRIAEDREIQALHGWNAHDYRAEDLASFFETARRTGASLNREEAELAELLFAAGILVRGGGGAIGVGEGAIVSISRESEDYLRTLFLVHEGYHGLFFTDPEFRTFAQERWSGLEEELKDFLSAYFDAHRYDVKDQYLMANELMAYCLQQPVASAAKYFGETLPGRLAADPKRARFLPPGEAAPSAADPSAQRWPSLAEGFTREAKAFSAFAERRWGLAAGRVWEIYRKSRATDGR